MGTTFLVFRTSNILVSGLFSETVSDGFVGLVAAAIAAVSGLTSEVVNSELGAAFRSGMLVGVETSVCVLLVRPLPEVDFALAIFKYSSHISESRNQLSCSATCIHFGLQTSKRALTLL